MPARYGRRWAYPHSLARLIAIARSGLRRIRVVSERIWRWRPVHSELGHHYGCRMNVWTVVWIAQGGLWGSCNHITESVLGKIRSLDEIRDRPHLTPYCPSRPPPPLKMSGFSIERLAVPFGTGLIGFLAFPSQLLFHYIEPGPLRKGDAYFFNAIVACVYICFYRTCFTDPGKIPQNWQERLPLDNEAADDAQASQRQRWCRKCEAFKPPRAHHCKTCRRLVLRLRPLPMSYSDSMAAAL